MGVDKLIMLISHMRLGDRWRGKGCSRHVVLSCNDDLSFNGAGMWQLGTILRDIEAAASIESKEARSK